MIRLKGGSVDVLGEILSSHKTMDRTGFGYRSSPRRLPPHPIGELALIVALNSHRQACICYTAISLIALSAILIPNHPTRCVPENSILWNTPMVESDVRNS